MKQIFSCQVLGTYRFFRAHQCGLRPGWIPKINPMKVQNTNDSTKGSQVTCVGKISKRFNPKDMPSPNPIPKTPPSNETKLIQIKTVR
ncbi:MAG: hypothetical protein CM1200mP16_01860 [Nitrospina sp.]|nr:MAG: hypothetical protein CM1200mP16_01860 [Nitrospina sp.]